MNVGGDAVVKRNDGLVLIDPEKASGNRALVDSCPYGAIYWNEELNLPQKCTGCAHLIDEGKLPRCVEACCTDALLFGEEKDFKDLISQAEVLAPNTGSKPRVYYLNLPKHFVSGEVWDPKNDEDLENATVILTDKKSGEIRTTKTDDFGDFWFNKLPEGVYGLKVELEGFVSWEIPELKVDKSLNIGDIPLKQVV
jgi:NAD-dependent dihydropyrimidine dehydrogenase PreA subunit